MALTQKKERKNARDQRRKAEPNANPPHYQPPFIAFLRHVRRHKDNGRHFLEPPQYAGEQKHKPKALGQRGPYGLTQYKSYSHAGGSHLQSCIPNGVSVAMNNVKCTASHRCHVHLIKRMNSSSFVSLLLYLQIVDNMEKQISSKLFFFFSSLHTPTKPLETARYAALGLAAFTPTENAQRGPFTKDRVQICVRPWEQREILFCRERADGAGFCPRRQWHGSTVGYKDSVGRAEAASCDQG